MLAKFSDKTRPYLGWWASLFTSPAAHQLPYFLPGQQLPPLTLIPIFPLALLLLPTQHSEKTTSALGKRSLVRNTFSRGFPQNSLLLIVQTNPALPVIVRVEVKPVHFHGLVPLENRQQTSLQNNLPTECGGRQCCSKHLRNPPVNV